MLDLGERMQGLRKEKKLSQTQVAKRLGLTRSSISGYENNLSQPSIDVLIKLAALYGTTIDYLVGVKKQPIIVLDGLTEQQQGIVISLIQNLVYEIKHFNLQLKQIN